MCWVRNRSASTGTIMTTAPAMSNGQFVGSICCSTRRPSARVERSSDFTYRRGFMKSLQYCTNVSNPTAAMAGFASGIAMTAQMRNAPRPSSRAASVRTTGWRRNVQ